MIIRALDTAYDFTFGKGRQDYLTDNNAIALNIRTRLFEFLNDCFFNTEAGLDWFRLLGTKATQQEIILSCRSVILQSYGVVQINRIDASFNDNRQLTLSFEVDTIFTLNPRTAPISQTIEVSQTIGVS